MARHARSGPVRDLLKHRLVVTGCALGALGAFGLAYADRSDHGSMLLWSGFGVFVGAITVIVASLSIGPRPLRSLGVGAWTTVAALGAGMGWLGRGSHAVTSGRGLMMPPLLFLMAVALLPLGMWLMVWRPEQSWEKELREERQRGRGTVESAHHLKERSRMRASRTGAAMLATALLAGGSFALGRATGDDVTWRTGTAVLGGDESSPQFSARLGPDDDWTYGAQRSVAQWVDADGSSHSGGWPDCLMPPTEQHPDRAQQVPIRFATVPVDDAELGSGPQVVAVDCRV